MSIVSKSIVSKSIVSKRVHAADAAFAPVRDFYMSSRYAKERFDPEACDFTFGNPHEMPLPGIVAAIRERALPHDKDWFAYKTSEEKPQAFLAEHVSRELGLAFEPADIALTAGAFAAIMVAFRLLLDAGDEAVFSEPAWFCYEPMLLAADAVPRKVALKAPAFDLDLAAIEAAIGPRTRLVIVNSPHNPTGRIYGRAMLQAVADMLERASARFGRRIFLLSDEPYRRLRFDGREFVSAAAIYPWTLISYSYGKVLLAPGQRLGYLAFSPLMPISDRQALRDVMFSAQMALGWCFPNAVMQYALADLEALSIDQAALARRRDRLTAVLTGAGFEVLPPEGTFYLWSKWPVGDPEQHWTMLADRKVFVLPGSIMNSPSYLRISLTASDPMVERALPAFAAIGGADA
jgi:aspartate aminotransferase